MKPTVTERGQISIPTRLRREMHLQAGQTVMWEKISDMECRLVALPTNFPKPDPKGALRFAKEHGLEEGSTDVWLRELRAGEAD